MMHHGLLLDVLHHHSWPKGPQVCSRQIMPAEVGITRIPSIACLADLKQSPKQRGHPGTTMPGLKARMLADSTSDSCAASFKAS